MFLKSGKTFIIAEAGVNHNGDYELARQLIRAASRSGADAIKFQMFKAGNLVSKTADKAGYQKKGVHDGETQFSMLKNMEFRKEIFQKLKKDCDKNHIMFLASPFCQSSADEIEDLVPLYKIPSGEITNIPLIRHIALKKKPILLSTGMASLGEIEEAIRELREHGSDEIVLLHCITAYPAPFQEVNLRAMATLAQAFKLPVGYSDHTIGIEIPIAAAALGARVIEKHFTMDRDLPGPDHKASLEPDELSYMVKAIRNVEKSLGDGIKRVMNCEKINMSPARKSVITIKDIRKGERFTIKNIACKRPGTGLPPKYFDVILGNKSKTNIPKDTVISWEYLL